MTSSVTGNIPYSYYNQLNPTAASTGAASTGSSTPATSDTDTDSSSTSAAPVDTVKLSPLVSSLLDSFGSSDSSSSSSILNSLLGGGSKTLQATVYANLLQTAYNNTAPQPTDAQSGAGSSDPLQDLLSGYHAYLNKDNTPAPKPATPSTPTDITA